MKKIIILNVIMCMTISIYAQTNTIPESEIPDGWVYYDGDEFNGNAVDHKYWGVYGDTQTGNSTYGQPQGMSQTYRPQQLTFDNGILCIHATRDDNPPVPSKAKTENPWWSGALSSRDANNYDGNTSKLYPLFCRIEVKAKIPYIYGVWMAIWLRHLYGASEAELDIEEFFPKCYEEHKSWLNQPYYINQTIHLYSTQSKATKVNLNGNDRYVPQNENPGNDFHVYGVEIDPDASEPESHCIIRFLFDGKVSNEFKTKTYGNIYNRFITRTITAKREMQAWDLAITGQIGGTDTSVGYPENRDPELRDIKMYLDWVRVFVRPDDTGINYTTKRINISANNGQIVVKDCPNNELITIMHMDGSLLKQVKSNGGQTTIDINRHGIYIVKVGKQVEKLTL